MGSGAFGRVVKADAVGLIVDQPVTTVAVKMAHSHQLNKASAIESLISEIKIMIHIGSHLNVVGLLGAVTKRISRGELFVLVEYCRFGNLCTFLRAQREQFINLVDSISSDLIQSDYSTFPSSTQSSNGYVDMIG